MIYTIKTMEKIVYNQPDDVNPGNKKSFIKIGYNFG